LNETRSSGAVSEPLAELQTHSFIVKIWLEEAASESGVARWRGSVTHVPGDERHNVSDLTQIGSFIARYLTEMGVRPSMAWRIWLWLFHP
jgi:hypothetical protein